MKTILAITPQSGGYPLKIVDPTNTEDLSPIVSLSDQRKTMMSTVKVENITDLPEQWDESWFANYE